MGEKFGELILKYVDKFGGFVEKAIDIAMVEIPKVITEYLTWHFYESIIDIVYSFLFVISSIIFFFLLIKFYKKKDEDGNSIIKRLFSLSDYDGGFSSEFTAVIIFLSGIITFIFTIIFFHNLNKILINSKKAIQIKVAPRVFLIQEAERIYSNRKSESPNGVK